MLRRLSATAIKPALYSVLLGLLLVLSTLCAFGTSVNATPDEINFVGTALRQEANIGYSRGLSGLTNSCPALLSALALSK